MYLEASDVVPYGKVHLISPIVPLFGYDKCLSFSYNARGTDIGELNVLDENYTPIFQLKISALRSSRHILLKMISLKTKDIF